MIGMDKIIKEKMEDIMKGIETTFRNIYHLPNIEGVGCLNEE